ncbi:MAG TPA: MFS transporter [Bryobacteraceae bacterium]|nr:MFS transporter [Bryobacteraceae bacterium]
MTASANAPAASRYRWVICSLLFFATVIAYIDRGIFGYLKETLQSEMGWDSVTYGNISAAFKFAYGVGICAAGWFTDRLGIRRGFAIAIVMWSVAAMSPGLAHSAVTFGIAMFCLGLGEAANFPACIKTVAEWFPRKERALATGLFNSGANLGNMLVPVVVPFLVATFTWRGSFAVAGSLGFVWLAAWLWLYAKPEQSKHVSKAELAHIESDPAERLDRVPWLRLAPRREMWAFAVAKFLTDPVWWFYTFWLPGYWQRTFHLTIESNRLPVTLAFGVATAGSIYGGYLSGALIKRGKSVGSARKTALLLCALAITPMAIVPYLHSLWIVVALVSVAMAAHQGWSANLFTVVSDLFPKAAVASVVGMGGLMGAAGGVLFDIAVGHMEQWKNGFVLVFFICGSMYLLALGLLHLLTPKFAPARLE